MRTSVHLLEGVQNGTAAMGNNLAFLQKTKQELPYDSAISLLRYISKGTESKDSETCDLMYIAALFIIAKYSSTDK